MVHAPSALGPSDDGRAGGSQGPQDSYLRTAPDGDHLRLERTGAACAHALPTDTDLPCGPRSSLKHERVSLDLLGITLPRQA